MDTESLLVWLATNAQAWMVEQRRVHRPDAVGLNPQLRGLFEPYFTSDILDRTRIRTVPSISNPPFYPQLQQLVPSIQLIDFRLMDGITFDDTVVVRHQANPRVFASLIFHELVHVAQYTKLGVEEFASRYVRGWFEANMQYEAIPLERDAYNLGARFDQRKPAFAVEKEVATQLSQRSAT